MERRYASNLLHMTNSGKLLSMRKLTSDDIVYVLRMADAHVEIGDTLDLQIERPPEQPSGIIDCT